MPLREQKCHTPKCANTFLAENGRRRLCDDCRNKRRQRKSHSRPWQRLPVGMDVKTYKRLMMQISRAEHWIYKNPHYRELALQRAKKAREILGRSYTGKVLVGSESGSSEPTEYRRCYNCAFWLKGEKICPRCGGNN